MAARNRTHVSELPSSIIMGWEIKAFNMSYFFPFQREWDFKVGANSTPWGPSQQMTLATVYFAGRLMLNILSGAGIIATDHHSDIRNLLSTGPQWKFCMQRNCKVWRRICIFLTCIFKMLKNGWLVQKTPSRVQREYFLNEFS